MRKTINKIFALVLSICMLMSVCVVVSSCSESTGADAYETGKIVYSNGGSTVVYDGYVYFINGVPNYTDKFGKTNNGSTVKGALYRSKITDYRDNPVVSSEEIPDGTNIRGIEHVADFDYEALDPEELGHYSIGSESETARKTVTDENGNVTTIQNKVINDYTWEYRVKNEPVIRKKIGTNGYKGGLYIFDGKIYFASPCNKKNSAGEYEYEKTEFYCYDINSEAMTLLYTTSEVNTAVPYVFYKQKGTVYLLTFEHYYDNAYDESYDIKTGFLISNAIENGKVVKKNIIAKGLEEVYFPEVETYNPDVEKDRDYIKADDFVYYTKKEKKDQTVSSDAKANTYTMGMILPSGKLEAIVSDNLNRQPTIKGVAGNYFYYISESLTGKKELQFTNLKAQFKKLGFDYDTPELKEKLNLKDMSQTEHTLISDMSAYTDVLLINDDPSYDVEQENIAVIAYTSSAIYRITANEKKEIWKGNEFEVKAYRNGRIYGLTGSFVASISAFSGPTESAGIKLLNVGLSKQYTYAECNWGLDFFPVSFETNYNGDTNYKTTEEYVCYMAGFSEQATHYMVVTKISGIYDGCCLEFADLLNEEKEKIVCYDERCINWYHDHSSWDTLETLTEEEKEQLEAQKEAEKENN